MSDQNTTFDSRNNCNAIIETATNTIIATCTQSTIPTTVTSIGDCAFYGRADLTHIAIPDQITTIGIAAFRDCKSLESVVIGDNLKIIDESAFLSCTSMTSFSIGKGIESIMRSAFMDCGKLETFICNAVTPPTTQWGTFEVSPTAVLYVPAESVDLYKNDNEWNDFYKILPLNHSYKSQWCDKWNTLCSTNNQTPVAQTWQYTLGQDTIIEGKTYTIVNRHWTIDPENTEEYVASVRFTNDDKVFVFYDNTEYLLYDFNVQVDDSVEVFAGINNYDYAKTYKGRVYDISYAENGVKICKISVPVSTYDDGYVSGGTYYSATWIEGIGDAQFGLLFGYVPGAKNEYSYSLLCAYKGDELMHETDHHLFDTYGCEYNGEIYIPRFFEGLQRTECSLHTTGVDSTYLVSCDRFVRYVIKNKLYWKDINSGSFFRETKDQIILSFPHGGGEECVLYDFSLEVGDTLPVMQYDEKTRGEMFRVVDVSMVTLLDGKEYKKWTLACGYEYIEKIGAINGKGLGNYIALGENTDLATYIGAPLVCASRNGQLLYQMDDAEMERLGAECLCQAEQNPEDLFPTLWGLQRTSLTVKMSPTLFSAKTDVRYIKNTAYLDFHGYFLREENNQVLIYSRQLEKDLILYDYSLEVGDTLTTLNFDYRIEGVPLTDLVVDYPIPDPYGSYDPIDTLIVTNILYVTLLDGKEYKQWTFNNGMQYVEGIGQFGQSIWAGDFFALIRKPNGFTWPDTRDYLVCASRNNKLLYQMDEAEMERLGAECLCDYNSGPKKDNAKNGKIGGRPTPTQWNMLEVETKEMDGTPTILRAETFSYTLENDSIVAKGKTFYQLARQSTKDTAITKSFVGALHFGEDEDNRVYFLRDGVEYVLYDFTAEPGDTIEIFAGINNYPQETTYTHVVTGKDTLENGACRMMLEVVFPEETASVENAQKVWLAGLGSIDGIVHNAANRTSDAHAAPAKSASSETQSSVMLCAWRDDNCLYTTNHPEYDTFGCVYNQDPTAVEEVETLGTQYQKILRDGHLYILRDNKLYDVLGTSMN